jgi:integrase
MSKTETYLDNRRDDIQSAPEDGAYRQPISDAILDFLDAYCPERSVLQPPTIQGERDNTLSVSSRLAYASTLHRTAIHLDLIDCDARDLNRFADARRHGEHPTVDEGISANTVHQNQTAWRKFYRFHDAHSEGIEMEADWASIHLCDRDNNVVDERDMFEPEEIEAMRNSCQNKRDRAMLEMLIFTGQRHNALRRLKYRDVRPDKGESGIIYLPDEEGLKGAEGKRPLLAAQKHVREWRKAHPTKDPDDAFFTQVYDWSGHDSIEAGDHLSRDAFTSTMKRIGERAGVEKPTNPHQFRHYFVTMAASKHGLAFDTIRHLLGHAPDSRELERTYQHLTDDDHIESAEVGMDITEEHEESLTPATCPTCGEPTQSSWSVCPNCEQTLTPDAHAVTNEIQQATTQDAMEDLDDAERHDLQELHRLLDDGELINQLVALAQFQDATDADVEDMFDQLQG